MTQDKNKQQNTSADYNQLSDAELKLALQNFNFFEEESIGSPQKIQTSHSTLDNFDFILPELKLNLTTPEMKQLLNPDKDGKPAVSPTEQQTDKSKNDQANSSHSNIISSSPAKQPPFKKGGEQKKPATIDASKLSLQKTVILVRETLNNSLLTFIQDTPELQKNSTDQQLVTSLQQSVKRLQFKPEKPNEIKQSELDKLKTDAHNLNDIFKKANNSLSKYPAWRKVWLTAKRGFYLLTRNSKKVSELTKTIENAKKLDKKRQLKFTPLLKNLSILSTKIGRARKRATEDRQLNKRPLSKLT